MQASEQTPPPSRTDAGWYPADPDRLGVLRYWDGGHWTDHHAHVRLDPAAPREAERNWLVAAVVLVVLVGALVVLNAVRAEAASTRLEQPTTATAPAVP